MTHRLLWIPRAATILLALSSAVIAQTSTPTPKPLFIEAPGNPFTAGTKPHSAAVGDFNGDGKLDLAIANQGSNNVTVLLGNGKGGFTEAPGSPFKVGAAPTSVAVADFNGDGKLDLAVSSEQENNVIVLLGNGKGGFTAGEIIPVSGNQPNHVAVGDFNGDGKADLAVASFGSGQAGSVSVLLGNGKGGFSEAPGSPHAAPGWWMLSVSVGDFNGDGKQDILATVAPNFVEDLMQGRRRPSNGGVLVLLADGSGGFTSDPDRSFAVQRTPQSVAVGDFNGDGKLDLVTANQGGDNVTVLLGDGAGKFTAASVSSFKVGKEPVSVAVGDFNGDGKLDLAIANRKDNTVTVLLGDGKGGFTEAPGSPFPVGVEPWSLAVGDFNGDGRPDLVVANEGSNNVTVLLNTTPGLAVPAAAKPKLKPPVPVR
jgi:uncharacterized protein (DUF2141 family)